MSEQIVNSGGYGYSSDEVKVSPFNFGGNFSNCFLAKMEWIPNGGKDGAEQEALDIVFKINDVDKNYRMFPVTKGFDKNNQPVTDPNSKGFKDTMIDWNARMTHIMHCFVPTDTLKQALAKPISSFKEYCTIIVALLPKDYSKKPLDIFLQYQWQISDGKNRTYLEIPKKMSYGKWLCAAIPGDWKEMRAENIDENTRKALWYVDANNSSNEHIFVKNGWFMSSNFAHQQKDVEEDTTDSQEAEKETSTESNTAGATEAAAW